MKVYISADIEGVTCATHWDETDRKSGDCAEFREQMTAEVAAACEGALAAGADEIWVRDAHWTGRNIIPSRLPREVRLVREWSGHPFEMMQELDASFHAALMVGYHSGAGSNTSPLAHTISRSISRIAINRQDASEFMMAAYTAGLSRVPVVFLSGDAGICREAEAFIPGLGTVAVMDGIGQSTVSIHPRLAVEKIRAGAEQSLKADVSRCRVPMPAHFSVEIAYKEHAKAYRAGFYPGAAPKDPQTVRFEADDYFEVLRFFLFTID